MQRGIAFATRDLFKQPMAADELRALAQRASVDAIFSWKSPTARQRGLAPGTAGDDDLIALMAAEPRLIRRPLILTPTALVIGADPKSLQALG